VSEPAAERPARILIADDEPLNRDLMALLVRALGHEAVLAADGPEALALARERAPDLVLLDVMMPGMDGFEVARRLKADGATRGVPIVIVSALDDQEARLRGLQAGAEDFLSRPVDRSELRARLRNLLRLKRLQDELAAQAATLEHKVRLRTEDLERGQREAIQTLLRVAAHKDDRGGAHVRRIGMYASCLAERLGMDAAFCDTLYHASQLHDVGLVAIPDRILDKPGPLDAGEWSQMREHCALGARMIGQSASPYLAMGREVAAAHHERWDGSGYPAGLKGEQIPLAARIAMLADTYDVLRERRAYKESVDHANAATAILAGDKRSSPSHFDPAVLAAFKASLGTFRDIYETVRD
jgi:putative two-component system response regulator